MSRELIILVYAALLQCGQFALYSVLANRQVGPSYALSPRDQPRQLTGAAGRAQRALTNHFEGLILFGIAVVALVLADKTTGLTEVCAWVYLVARLLYVPAYILGMSPWRSVVWFAGFLATVVMLLSSLF